jgi:maleylpyruvate isomerase
VSAPDRPPGGAPAYRLYHYWRSSSSWRVRWALAIKDVAYEPFPVHLLNGESESANHLARNPAGFVPVLELLSPLDATALPVRLTESLAIIQYLETLHPEPALLPRDSLTRARAWALAEVVNAGIQPLANIPVFERHSSDPSEQKKWNQHWIRSGLETYEKLAAPHAGCYSVGDAITVADLCLMPQLYNAERFGVTYDDLSTLSRIAKTAAMTSSYLESHPDRFKPAEFA